MKTLPTNHFRWAVLSIAALAYFQSSFHRVAAAPLIPYLTNELAISNAMAGAIISAYFIPYMLLQVPAGQVADRYGAKWAIPPALLSISVSALWFSSAFSYEQSFASRVLMGVSAAFIFPPALKAVVSYFPPRERARGIGFYVTGGFAGASVALAAMPLIAISFGWRSGYAMTSSMTLAALLLSIIVLRKASRSSSSNKPDMTQESVAESTKPSLINVLKNRYIIIGGIIDLTDFGTAIGLATWTYIYAVNQLGVPAVEAGLIPSMSTVGTGIAQILVGFISDKIGRRKPFLLGALLSGSFCVLLFTFIKQVWLIYIISALIGGSIGVAMVMVFSMASEQVRKEDAGVAVGLVNMLAAIGPIATPYIAGFLLDTTGSFNSVFIFLATLLAGGLVLSLFEKEGKDLKKTDRNQNLSQKPV